MTLFVLQLETSIILEKNFATSECLLGKIGLSTLPRAILKITNVFGISPKCHNIDGARKGQTLFKVLSFLLIPGYCTSTLKLQNDSKNFFLRMVVSVTPKCIVPQ